jgi:hypothetical protein
MSGISIYYFLPVLFIRCAILQGGGTGVCGTMAALHCAPVRREIAEGGLLLLVLRPYEQREAAASPEGREMTGIASPIMLSLWRCGRRSPLRSAPGWPPPRAIVVQAISLLRELWTRARRRQAIACHTRHTCAISPPPCVVRSKLALVRQQAAACSSRNIVLGHT